MHLLKTQLIFSEYSRVEDKSGFFADNTYNKKFLLVWKASNLQKRSRFVRSILNS